jgi:hypothetical protein
VTGAGLHRKIRWGRLKLGLFTGIFIESKIIDRSIYDFSSADRSNNEQALWDLRAVRM